MLMWRLCKIYITPTVRQNHFFVEKYFDSWDTKIHGHSNYLQSFYVTALIDKCGTTKKIHLQCLEMVSKKDEIACYMQYVRWGYFVIL